MQPPPAVPIISEDDVLDALERLRQAEPLGDSPLRGLLWVHQQVSARGAAGSALSEDVALGDLLIGLIEENLSALRAMEGLDPGPGDTRTAVLDAMRQDFAQENAELEAWSVLYHRYVAVTLDLQVRTIATELSTSARQVHRRRVQGIRRLAEAISRRELAARAANRRLWLRLKLPPAVTPAPAGVNGRAEALAGMLCAADGLPALVVTGPGGIGKTTLAREAAWLAIERGCFDEVAWLALKGPTAYPTTLSELARGVGYIHLTETAIGALEAALAAHFAAARALVVVDGAGWLEGMGEQAARLGRLLNSGRLVATSRQRPGPESPCRVMTIPPLSREAFSEALQQMAEMGHVSAGRRPDAHTVDRIYEAVGGNPLAARLIVGQLAFLPLDAVLDGLPGLFTAGGETLFERLFERTWAALSHDAHLTAAALTLLPPGSATRRDLLTLTGLAPEALNAALGELVSGSLVEVQGSEPRYAMHALAARFVEGQIPTSPLALDYEQLLGRAIDAQRHPRPGNTLTGADAALALARRAVAAEGETAKAVRELVQKIAPTVRRSGQWAAWRDVLLPALGHVDADAAPGEAARLLLELGIAYRWLGELDRAVDVLERAVAGFGLAGDFTGQAEALLALGQTHQITGQTAPAYEAYQRAAAAAHRYQSTALRCQALNRLAGLALYNHLPQEAEVLLEEALALQPGDGLTLSNLGMAHLAAGRPDLAADYQRRALEALQEAGDLPSLARAHLRMGMACHDAWQRDQALYHLQAALELMGALGDAIGQARSLTNLGAVYAAQQRWADALTAWREAADLQQRLGDEVGLAHTWYNLADLRWQLGQAAEAVDALAQARQLAERLSLSTLLGHIDAHPAGRQGDD